ARFAALGMPAVNFGPGNPTLAHTRQENVRTAEIRQVTEVLRKFLG
ncbi:MAG TPA: succinyl-diaminopimelate desuccinylase, partial [Amycolatopsis sp.]